MSKIGLFIKRILHIHKWHYTSINYYDSQGNSCTDAVCKICGKQKTFKRK